MTQRLVLSSTLIFDQILYLISLYYFLFKCLLKSVLVIMISDAFFCVSPCYFLTFLFSQYFTYYFCVSLTHVHLIPLFPKLCVHIYILIP